MKKRILDTLPDSKLAYSTQVKAGLADGSIDKNKISDALDRLLNGDFGSAPAAYKNVFTEHLEDGTRDIYGIYDDIVIYYDANVDDLTVTTTDEFRRFYKKGWTSENQTAFNTRYAGGGESRRNAKIEGQYLKEGQRRAIIEQLREDYGTEKAGFEKSARLEYKVYPYLQYKGIVKALTEDQLQYLKKLSSEYNVPMHKILNEVGFQHFVQHKNMQTSVDLVERMIQKGVASIMSKDAAHSPHKYYVVLYKDEFGWDPAEGGTVYFAGERVSKKEGPFTYEEAQEKLKEKADIFGDVGTIRSGKDYLVINHPEEGTLYYRIERDDRWGSKQTGGGGWDWSAEKDPAKHPFRGKYVVIDKTTGEVVAENRDRYALRIPAGEYMAKIFREEKRIPNLELHKYGDQGSHKVVGSYIPYEGGNLNDSADESTKDILNQEFKSPLSADGEKLDSIKKLFNWMKDNIEYTDSDAFDKKYGIQGTTQLIQTKKGHCFDTSNMLIDVLRKNGFDVSAYFILEVDENGNGGTSHTFVVLKENDHSYYWIEVSWDNKQGIHHYSSLNAIFDDVFKSWDFADEQKYLLFWDADYYATKDGVKDYIRHFIGEDDNEIKPFKKYEKDQKVSAGSTSDSVDEDRNCYIVKYKNIRGRKAVTGNFAEVSDLTATGKKGPFTREEAQKLLDNQEAEAKEQGKYCKSNSKDGYLFIDFGDYSVTYRIECKEPDADLWPNTSEKDPVPQPYRDLKKFTIHGYPIVAVYKDAEGRKFVVVKMGAQYAYGAGYDPETGKWDAGYVGFTDPSDAIVDMQEHYGRMKKSTL